jgi:long-subunit acyl-CoA synthetase (AMP-forming)
VIPFLGILMQRLGVKHAIPLNRPKPEDLGILMFTSGTTGEPKAAMLTHRAVATAVENVLIGLLVSWFFS